MTAKCKFDVPGIGGTTGESGPFVGSRESGVGSRTEGRGDSGSHIVSEVERRNAGVLRG